MNQKTKHDSLKLHLTQFRSSKKFHIIAQLFRYGIVGGLAFCTQFFIVLLLVHFLKFSPMTANVYGFCCGFFVAFLGHRFWTFRQSTRQLHKLFLHFLMIGLINLALNQTLYYFFLTRLHLHYAVALPIVIAIATSIIFCVNKIWVFRA